MANDLGSSIQKALIDFLSPLQEAASDPKALIDWLATLGQTPTVSADPALLQIARNASAVIKKLSAFDSTVLESWTGIDKLLESAGEISDIQRELRRFAEAPKRIQIADGLAEEVLSLMLAGYLRRRHPTSFRIACLLTLIEARENSSLDPPIIENEITIRYPRLLDRFNFAAVNGLINRPGVTLKKAYFANDLSAGADAWSAAERLFPNLSFLADELGLSWRTEHRPVLEVPPQVDLIDTEPIDALLTRFEVAEEGEELPPPRPPPIPDAYFAAYFPTFRLVVARSESSAGSDAAIELLASSAQHPGTMPGYVLTPTGNFNTTITSGLWRLTLSAKGRIPAFVIKATGVELAPGGLPVSGGVAKLILERLPPEDSSRPAFVFGSAGGSRLELGSVSFEGALFYDPARKAASLSAKAGSCSLVIASGDADGFLSRFLPAKGLRAKFDLGLEWSNERGLTFQGAAGLDATLPIGLSLGALSVPTLHLSLQASNTGVVAEVSASVALSIGPVRAVVDRIGINSVVSFPKDGGNLGVADLTLGFKPPLGVGIKVDSPFVTGGGFLSFDLKKGEYAGAILLNLEGGITVTAIGMITTRLPNRAKGFSFVVLITAQGFQPIPLGLGFTLTAIGGLLAINRTCDEEFLGEGIKNDTLNDLLFPKDPIRNAPQIFGTLNKAFPPHLGSHLFGPIVQIRWGTPPLLTMDLGLVLELGNRRRLIILGRVSAIMPTEKHDQIRLQMNAFGIIDFDQKSISLDAFLYDSRLVGKFPITGGMAMRLRWGSAPVFALSIGGFHPAFKPPPRFPVLKRLAISLSDTENFRLRIECYLAITSNTLQFGAKVELMASAGRFSIEGRLSFDVLIQFDPFFFVADFQASVQLKLHSHNLFSVDVKGQLSGPRPLHIKGKATFGIFWCHFSVRFDKTLVEGERPPRLEPVNVTEQLMVALNDARNWSGQLAEGERRAVTLRETGDPDQINLHPLGRLSVKQNVVPLELEIAKYGNTTPAGARLFKINKLSVNGKETEFSRVNDFFAPAQFLELSEDEKLAAPSFEAMMAGISVGAESFLFTMNEGDILEDEAITYETIIVDREFAAEIDKPRRRPTFVAISREFLDRHLSLGAAARSDVRRTGIAKYRPAAGKNLLVKKGWTIASTEDGTHQGAPGLEAGKVVSYSESFQALQRLKQANPVQAKTLMLIRVEVK